MSLFVAVEVPGRVRDGVAAAVAPLRVESPGLRWVAPERYHLTVVFLGELAPGAVAGVVRALAPALAGVAPFAVALSGEIGAFGQRVLWAGLAPSPALSDVAARVRNGVGAVVALPDGDRPFSAHLTLARAGRSKIVVPAEGGSVAVPRLPWTVDRVVLMRSAGGYSVEHMVALRGVDA